MPCLNRDKIVQLVSHTSLDIAQLISGGTFDKKKSYFRNERQYSA